MLNDAIYLDSYTLQSDSRIRLPKSAIENIKAIPGRTRFKIYFDKEASVLLLQVCADEEEHKNAQEEK